jgi:uncharacterized membrane protein
MQPLAASPVPSAQLVTYTHVIYALHAASILIGATSTVIIVWAFVAGLPSLVAIVMNYARRSDALGTWLESHFRWQIRTFWFALLAFALASVVSVPLLLSIVLIPLVWLGFAGIGVWVIYRVVRGWIHLREARPMYV